ncbi:MAG: nitrous oxide reductase family maturation protein NosD [Chitinophagales bacterium]|nr:nitrous oxide reductase family maturation protein NosD [Chitinophagales bacterium]MCZ2393571.1 nitrous oxide reductase family maturation protein NosD [Chitinophagales bacterium]
MGRVFTFKISLFLFFPFWILNGYATTIVVSPVNQQKVISNAFQQLKDGDTLIVKSGVYQEGAILLNKGLTIIGEGLPVIDGENKYENLLVEHDNVRIKGVVFKNSGSSSFTDIAALKIKNSKNIVVENCRFENNFFGIHTINSSNVSYLNNELISGMTKGKPSSNGIHCWKSKHLTLKNNTIKGHRDGIYFEFVTQSLIENNHSVGNKRYGLHFMFSHDNLYKKNEFRSNGAGVAVMYSKRVHMVNNLFAENWGNAAYGVLLKEIDDSKIENNVFHENTIAILSDGANRIQIFNNQFLKNGWALKVQASCSDVELNQNNFIGNTFDLATNGNLVMKSMDRNYWDKYEGYDLNKDGIGDVPYRPITFYSLIIERNPGTLMLFRSFFVKLMDKAESVFPSLTPENLKDTAPVMKKIKHLTNDSVFSNK